MHTVLLSNEANDRVCMTMVSCGMAGFEMVDANVSVTPPGTLSSKLQVIGGGGGPLCELFFQE